MPISRCERNTVARAGELHICPTFSYIPRMCNSMKNCKIVLSDVTRRGLVSVLPIEADCNRTVPIQ